MDLLINKWFLNAVELYNSRIPLLVILNDYITTGTTRDGSEWTFLNLKNNTISVLLSLRLAKYWKYKPHPCRKRKVLKSDDSIDYASFYAQGKFDVHPPLPRAALQGWIARTVKPSSSNSQTVKFLRMTFHCYYTIKLFHSRDHSHF